MERVKIRPPFSPKTHEPTVTKIGDEVGDIYHCAKFHYDPIGSFVHVQNDLAS